MMLELMRFCRVGAQVLRRGHNLFKTRSFDLEFLSACQEVIETNFSLLCHLYWV